MEEKPDGFDEQEVRDLLAALGRTTTSQGGSVSDTHDAEPLPADVARRLDDLLDELVAERSREATVTPLRDTRRTGPVRGWLAAAGVAAAVVLATVVLPALLDPEPTTAPTADSSTVHDNTVETHTPDSDATTEEFSNLESGAAASVIEDVEISGPLVDEGLGAYPEQLSDQFSGRITDGAPLTAAPGGPQLHPQLHHETLAQDVVDLLADLPTRTATTHACAWDGAGEAYDVTLDGRRGLAVVTGSDDGERVVRLLACSAHEGPVEMATATVPPG